METLVNFRIEIFNGYASINEWHKECVTVLGREVGGSLSGSEEKWCAICLDSKRLFSWLTATRDNFTWTPTYLRVQAQITRIKSGKTIDTPVMYRQLDTTDSISILDGRHRTAALHQLCAVKIPVMVPESQTKLFLRHFG